MESIQSLVFDLETLPGLEKPTPADLKPPAQYKKPESIEAWRNDPKNLEEAYRKQALDPYKGRILSIAWILDDEPVRGVINADEKTVLEEFQAQLKQQFKDRFDGVDTIVHPTLIGHNIRTFDFTWIWLRLLKYDLSWLLKVVGDNIDDIRYKDTMMAMGCLNSYRTFVSLDAACAFFGIKGKTEGMDGSQVYDYFLAGRLEEIDQYCQDDTVATYKLAKKLRLIN